MNSSTFDLVVLGGGIVGLWTARRAARAGANVAVVECGPASLAEQRSAAPPIRFLARSNIGALRARNHVLTGNSSYWGGGLVRNSNASLIELYGTEVAAAVARAYPTVERELGVGAAFAAVAPKLRDRDLHEIAVLPGRKRGLWSGFREPRVNVLADHDVTRVECGERGRLERLTVRDRGGAERQLVARSFALSMGVLDSNLFVQRHLAHRLAGGVRALLGTRLHDHWSVPLATVQWRAAPAVVPLFPPKFRGGVVAGRRVTMDRGFFHLTADFDATPPYDRVKELLRVRQQGGGFLAICRATLATMTAPALMLRAGIHYLAKRELRIPDGSPVKLVYDFESARDLENRIVLSGATATLNWDLRAYDHAHFQATVRAHRAWWEQLWNGAGIDARWLFDSWTDEDLGRHLAMHAIDAYHLGGGLHPDTDVPGVSEADGALRGCPNLFVNGTAFFCRPGPGNPVLTLLARASVYVTRLAHSEDSP